MKCPIKAQRFILIVLDYLRFDLYLLKRPGAEKDYSADEIKKAKKRNEELTAEQKREIVFEHACWVCREVKIIYS